MSYLSMRPRKDGVLSDSKYCIVPGSATRTLHLCGPHFALFCPSPCSEIQDPFLPQTTAHPSTLLLTGPTNYPQTPTDWPHHIDRTVQPTVEPKMFDFAVRTCKEQLSTGKNQMLMSKGVKVSTLA